MKEAADDPLRAEELRLDLTRICERMQELVPELAGAGVSLLSLFGTAAANDEARVRWRAGARKD